MANTIIQIKRSNVTATPPNGSLVAGELAISYSSNVVFAGTADDAGIIPIGGLTFVNRTNAAYDLANTAFITSNAVSVSVNAYANAIGAAANAYVVTVGTAGNNYTIAVGLAGNAYALATATAVGTAGNNFTIALQNGSNTAVGAGANAYALSLATAGNNFTSAVGLAGNAYTTLVGASANSYANGTFVKLTAPNQTITGTLTIAGNLIVTGNSTVITANNLAINDPFILLANNNVGDSVDIGIAAHYDNASAFEVHTGIFRSHISKEWYLFKEYNQHFFYDGGQIDVNANNFTLDTLNAVLKTSDLTLGGQNAILWISSAFTKANDVALAANAYALATATSIGTAGNAYALATATSVGTAGNNYATAVGAAANAYALATATSIGTAGNNYTIAVGTAGNNYAVAIGTAANTNAANASYLTTGTVPSARLSGSYTGITGVGTLTAGTWNGNTITVPYGGTGATTFTSNGVLYGSGTAALKVTAAGTEGKVLQANAGGVPVFDDLDGGTF